MKALKLLCCFLPFFLSQQSQALIAVGTIADLVCWANFEEDGIVFVGKYLEHTTISETDVNGNEHNIYLVKYQVEDVWCSDIRTDFATYEGAPEWVEDLQNTETEVWSVVQLWNQTWPTPEPNQRQFIAASGVNSAYYLTANFSSTLPAYTNGPIDITSENTITGNLTEYGEPQTLTLEDFRTVLSECSGCTMGSGIESLSIEVHLFPNPVNENVQIRNEIFRENSMYSIYSVDGRIVQSGSVNDDLRIDASALITGLYLFTVVDEQGIIGSGEFLKE